MISRSRRLAAIALWLAFSVACATTGKDRAAATIRYDIAVAEMSKGNFRQALSELLLSVELDEEIPQAHNALGLVYHALGKTDEALTHYHSAVRLDPKFSDAHNNLGILLMDLGRYDEAIASFQAALSNILYATPSLAEGNMGWALYRKGDVEAGKTRLRNAVATNPKFCRGYEWLARIGLDTGDSAQVVADCRRFDKHCLGDPDIKGEIAPAYLQEMSYYCGLGQLKDGDVETARATFQQCADPTGEGFALRCAESLRGLESDAPPSQN